MASKIREGNKDSSLTIGRMNTIVWDDWQKEVLACKGNKVICTGRQVGKSTVISKDAGDYAVATHSKTILIISAVERQALLLFEKVFAYIYANHKNMIKKGKHKPTKHTLRLTNGSIIHCLPTGLSGYGIRGYTIDRLYADEAAFIPEDVWTAVTPMLATTGGDIILLSTPLGRSGYFYQCSKDPAFTYFHVSTEEVANKRKDPQRTRMLEFLRFQENSMSKIQYAQEFLGEFIDKLKQFFPDDLIRKCMRQVRPKYINREAVYFLGSDIARMGDDESTYEILRHVGDKLIQVENQITTKTHLTDTAKHIMELDKLYDFYRIYIDDEGIGIGVYDMLMDEDRTKRKTIGINNSQRAIGKDRRKRLLKEHLYHNLLRLMETEAITLLDDPEIFQSLKSVQFEYTTDTIGRPQMKIFGNYTHVAEGLIRAAWGVKEKGLNCWISSIKV